MKRTHKAHHLPPEWPLLVHHYVIPGGPGQSLWTSVQYFPEPRRLIYDIHPALELGITTAGEELRIFSDLSLNAGPGDVWLIPAWEPHGSQIALPETRAVMTCFLPGFLGEERLGDIPWLSLFAVPPSQRPRVRTEATRARVLSIAAELQREIEGRLPGCEEAVRYNLLRLLLTLRREWDPPGFLSADSASAVLRIMPVINAFHSRPERRLSLEQAAAMCSLSASRFAVLFRRAMGKSFGSFCLHARLTLAAKRLSTINQSIEEIAARLNFSSGSHLHRAFLKHFGATPAAYRDRKP